MFRVSLIRSIAFLSILIFAWSLSMDQKPMVALSSLEGKTLNEKLITAVTLNLSKSEAIVSQLLDFGADVNTVNDRQEHLLYSAARNNNMPVIKLFLIHPHINVYAPIQYLKKEQVYSDSDWEEVDILEWAWFQKKNDLVKLLVYLGHESHELLAPEDNDNSDMKTLLTAPHEYPFTEKEKNENENLVRAIGYNNGEKIKRAFYSLPSMSKRNKGLAVSARLMGEYLGLGLLPETKPEDSGDFKDCCTIL